MMISGVFNKSVLKVAVSRLVISGLASFALFQPCMAKEVLPVKTPLTATTTTVATSTTLNADPINWADYTGKVVYVDFWASWCGPCRQSFPWMKAMQAKYAKEGLVILAINVDQDPKKASTFLKELQPNFTIKYDPKGKLAEQFGVKTMPSSFMIGRDGKPATKHMGFHDTKVASYEDELKVLLAKK